MSEVVRDQDGTEIEYGDILLDERGRTYLIGETEETIRAQQIISGRRRNRMGYLSAEYIRAYHAFIVPEHVSVDDGKLLHRERLAVGAADRVRAMKARHQATDKTLRERGIRQ